jgi:hypothetical protein
MKLFEKENENRDYLFNKLKDNAEIAEKNCLVGTEIPVPYKHIYIPVRKSLEIWCFKQDICVYQQLFDKSVDSRKLDISSENKSMLKVTVEKNAGQEKDVGMPFVIVETKMADAQTDTLLASSEKIKMIKSIFPYCKAFLLVFGSPHQRVFRLCSGFDEILFIEGLDEKNCECVINKVIKGTSMAYNYIIYVASHNYPYEPGQ